MLRYLVAGLAALVATGCTYGSAVDIAPFKDRLAKAVVADGDYCEITNDAAPLVNSSEGCVRLQWNGAARTTRVTDLDPKNGDDKAQDSGPSMDDMDVAVVSLGGGVYAAQVDVETEGPDKHQINLFIASGDAFATIPTVADEVLVKLAKKHRKITWADMPAPADEQGLFAKTPWIKAGSVKDIRTFLKEAAREGLRPRPGDDPNDKDWISVGVRDTDKAPNHAPTAKQLKDTAAVKKIALKLKPK